MIVVAEIPRFARIDERWDSGNGTFAVRSASTSHASAGNTRLPEAT
jgi:hypothetical protein